MHSFDVKHPDKVLGKGGSDNSRSLIIGAVLLSISTGGLIGLFGGLIATLSLLVIFFMVIAMSDYRAGLLVAIVLLPLSSTYFLPRELFGIIGFNPLNLTLLMSLISLLYLYLFQRGDMKIPPCPGQFWIYLGALSAATFLGSFHASSIPAFYKTLQLINFDNAIGYVRDIFLKPLIIVMTSFILAIAVRNAKRPVSYLIPLLVSALTLPIFSIAYIALSGMSLQALSSSEERGFLNVTGMHANELGLMFNMAFALTLFSSLSVSGALRSWLLGSTAAVLLVASVLTFSRGAFLGLLTVIAYFLYTQKKFKIMLAGVALIPVAILLLPQAVLERATTGTQTGDVEAISAGRVDNIWRPLLPEVLDSPVIGHGLSSILWSDSARNGAILKVGHPHNAYLGILLDMGLVGAVVVFMFFLHMWRLFRRLVRDAQEPIWHGFFRGATACILLLLVQGITDDRFTPTFPQTFLWLSYGIALGLTARQENSGQDEAKRSTGVATPAGRKK